jgi:hypothetical protein
LGRSRGGGRRFAEVRPGGEFRWQSGKFVRSCRFKGVGDGMATMDEVAGGADIPFGRKIDGVMEELVN